MIDINGKSVAKNTDNVDVFPQNIAVFRLETGNEKRRRHVEAHVKGKGFGH